MDGDTRSLSPAEKRDWLRLLRSENIGTQGFYDLLQRFGSAEAAIAALPGLASRGGRREPVRIATIEAAEEELGTAEAAGARVTAVCEPAYPALLRAVPMPPPLLFVRGRPALFTRPAVGVIGARNASSAGRRFARRLAEELAGSGLAVISGLARGIDTEAHEGALAGGTVGVLAGGIDVIYPPENAGLAERMLEAGALVSEARPGQQPLARLFPRRNRIISGLSLGVVVVEAAVRSGSLITARFALEQGREVFAVPGFPTDPRHGGTNHLIRQGAVLTEGAGDVIEALGPMMNAVPVMSGPAPERPDPGELPGARELDQARRKVVDLLGPTPVDIDDLVRQVQLTPATVMTILLELELAGRLDRHAGNRVSIC